MSVDLNPLLLAATTPDPDSRLLPLLRSKPELASQQDSHGYSLLHAAASYNHVDLLRTLVQEFKVDVNLKDEDGETCLFVSESVEAAKCLLEELHIDVSIQNEDGQTALQKLEVEEDYPEVADYLRGSSGSSCGTEAAAPQLPPNINIAVSTAESDAADQQEPDPEFRRRIEELAASEVFQTEQGQRELRDLITDAVRDVSNDRDVRRRVG